MNFVLFGALVLAATGVAACSYTDNPARIRAAYNSAATDFNKHATTVQIEMGTAIPVLNIAPVIAKYGITIDRGLVGDAFFQAEEYTLATGGLSSVVPLKDLCTAIGDLQAARVSRNAILKDLKAKVGGQLGPASLELEGTLETVLDVGDAFATFLGVGRGKVVVAIKGYADGERARWERDLKPGYEFDSIRVTPPLNPRSDNPLVYGGDSIIVIPESGYQNVHLPDLRAEFIRRDFIEPMLGQCFEVPDIEVYVLKGYEFTTETQQPLLRRAQVFVYVFPD